MKQREGERERERGGERENNTGDASKATSVATGTHMEQEAQ